MYLYYRYYVFYLYYVFLDNNFTSFQRQLNLYGFKRLRFNSTSSNNEALQLLVGIDLGTSVNNGAYKGSYIYSHPFFSLTNRLLCDEIRRTSTVGIVYSNSDDSDKGFENDDLLDEKVNPPDDDEIYKALLQMRR